MTNEVILAGAVRTPIGTFGGSFAETPATELGAVALREALKRAGVAPEQVDEFLAQEVAPIRERNRHLLDGCDHRGTVCLPQGFATGQ